MNSIFRIYVAIALSLLVTLTAQGAAVARAMPVAIGMMELCSRSGPAMVYMDENGQPTAPPHLCPDMAPALVLAIGLPAAELSPPTTASCAEVSDGVVAAPRKALLSPLARGPPVPV